MLVLLVLVGGISTISSWLGKIAKQGRETRRPERPSAAASAMAEIERELPGFALGGREESGEAPSEEAIEVAEPSPLAPPPTTRPRPPVGAARAPGRGLAEIARVLEEAARAAGLAPATVPPPLAPAPAPVGEGEEAEAPFVHPQAVPPPSAREIRLLPRLLGGGPATRTAAFRGVLWAEVLGPPRSRRPWRPGGIRASRRGSAASRPL